MSANNGKNSYVAALSADFLAAMLRNPNNKPDDGNLAAYAVAQVVALDKALDDQFEQCDQH